MWKKVDFDFPKSVQFLISTGSWGLVLGDFSTGSTENKPSFFINSSDSLISPLRSLRSLISADGSVPKEGPGRWSPPGPPCPFTTGGGRIRGSWRWHWIPTAWFVRSHDQLLPAYGFDGGRSQAASPSLRRLTAKRLRRHRFWWRRELPIGQRGVGVASWSVFFRWRRGPRERLTSGLRPVQTSPRSNQRTGTSPDPPPSLLNTYAGEQLSSTV